LLGVHLSGQKAEDASALEDLAHSRTRVHNPQPAVDGCGQVERPHQLADAGGIDSRDVGEVEHNHPFTTPKERSDTVAQLSTHRPTQRAPDGNGAGIRATQLENYAQIRPPLTSDAASRSRVFHEWRRQLILAGLA
jgi:hypothetical protein